MQNPDSAEYRAAIAGVVARGAAVLEAFKQPPSDCRRPKHVNALWALEEAIDDFKHDRLNNRELHTAVKMIHGSFGAPGDFGYGTPEGDSLRYLYDSHTRAYKLRYAMLKAACKVTAALIKGEEVYHHESVDFVQALLEYRINAGHDVHMPQCHRLILWHPDTRIERSLVDMAFELEKPTIIIVGSKAQRDWANALTHPQRRLSIYISATEYLDELATADAESQTSGKAVVA